jgi:cytochrome c
MFFVFRQNADLPNAAILFRFRSVSLAEIRDQIAGLTVEERLDVAALIAHLNRVDDPEYRSELDQRAADMDAGKKSTLDDLERQHQRLATGGR